jgi:hypothetical protein
MDKVHETGDSECYTPSSGLITFYKNTSDHALWLQLCGKSSAIRRNRLKWFKRRFVCNFNNVYLPPTEKKIPLHPQFNENLFGSPLML